MSTTALTNIDIANEITVAGGQSSAFSSIINGNTRESEATTQIGSVSLLGGLVVLSGLKWESMQSTGAKPTSSSTFSITSVSVAGDVLPVTVSTLSSVFDAVNAALSSTGFHVSLPHETLGSDGTVQETPLSVGIDNSALGQKAVGPAVSTLQPLRNEIFDALSGVNATTGEVDLFAEIALGILAGQGNLDLDFGGTYATTSGATFTNPFGTSSAGPPTDAQSIVPASNSATTTTNPTLSLGAVSSAGLPVTQSSIPSASNSDGKKTGLAYKELGRTTLCQSSTVGSCHSGAPVPVVLILLLLTGSLIAAELLRQRRRRRSFIENAAQGSA
jgi:hypothetical protein